MQQSTAFWYLFDSITKKVDSTNIVLGYSLLEATSKELGEKEVLFNYFDGMLIWDFGNAWDQSYGKAWWHDPLSRTWE